MIKPIKAKRVSDMVSEQIRDLIFKGQLKPGEKLMNERELAEAFGVGRPTVREAINKLVALRLLENRPRQGTFVNPPPLFAESNPLGILNLEDIGPADMYEVRLGLECNAAVIAARRATEEDIRDMERSLDAMIDDIRQDGLGSTGDVSFHMAIAYATRNILQLHVMKSLYDYLHYGIKESLQKLYANPSDLQQTVEQHSRILKAIRERNPEAAGEAMREHITFQIELLRNMGPGQAYQKSAGGIEPSA